jgi:hypothetical protein
MRKVQRVIDKAHLGRFKQYLLDDGWEFKEPEPMQALKAWKINFKGEKRKWCILNHSPNLDATELVIPAFSTPMTEDFFRKYGL